MKGLLVAMVYCGTVMVLGALVFGIRPELSEVLLVVLVTMGGIYIQEGL